MSAPLVTVIIVTRNSIPHLDGCLGSMLNQSYPNHRILIVDSGSTDSTVAHIRSRFPDVHLIPFQENLGYRKGNRMGMRQALGEYVVVCNDDVKVDRHWLAEMVQAMESDPSLGLITPKILLYDDPGTINVAGNVLHFSGMYGSRGLGDPASKFSVPEELATVSGCCFMIRRKALDQLQGFSEDFDQLDTGWHASFEDVDLAWRAQLLGWRIGYVPSSILYHKYRRKPTTPEMFCSYEWGRWLIVLRNYSFKSLLLTTPILILLDGMAWIYAVLKGRAWIRAKWKVLHWIISNKSIIRSMRCHIQNSRVVPDRVIVQRMSPTIHLAHFLPWPFLGKVVERAFDIIFSLCYYPIFLGLRFGR